MFGFTIRAEPDIDHNSTRHISVQMTTTVNCESIPTMRSMRMNQIMTDAYNAHFENMPFRPSSDNANRPCLTDAATPHAVSSATHTTTALIATSYPAKKFATKKHAAASHERAVVFRAIYELKIDVVIRNNVFDQFVLVAVLEKRLDKIEVGQIVMTDGVHKIR